MPYWLCVVSRMTPIYGEPAPLQNDLCIHHNCRGACGPALVTGRERFLIVTAPAVCSVRVFRVTASDDKHGVFKIGC